MRTRARICATHRGLFLYICQCGLLAAGCSFSFPPDIEANPDEPTTLNNDDVAADLPVPPGPDQGESPSVCTDGQPCDDGDACTEADTCREGVCVGTALPNCTSCEKAGDCDDDNPCTDDVCDPARRCGNINNTASCSDGGTCVDGGCVVLMSNGNSLAGLITYVESDSPVDVDAPVAVGSRLRLEAPDPAEIRRALPTDCVCEWSLRPTNVGTLYTPNDCVTECTVERAGDFTVRVSVSCVENETTVFEQPLAAVDTPSCPDGDACDDGNPCTEDDVCTDGACAGSLVDGCATCATNEDCDDGNPCSDDTCGTDGICIAKHNTAPCDDGHACTFGDQCAEGTCAGAAVECSGLNDTCNVGSCNALNGVCQTQPTNEGGACDDGNPNTKNDVCTQGVCGGVEPRWSVALQDLPAAILSVRVVSSGDVYAVGADPGDGSGGYVLHYDGQTWRRLVSGTQGDFWWLHEVAPNQIWMSGENRLVVRFDPMGEVFTPVAPPAGSETLFGIWGLSTDDIWAVGGTFTQGVILHYDGNDWSEVDVQSVLGSAPPPMFKVWGPDAGNVWFVGQAGVTLQYDGANFTFRQTASTNTLFTVHGDGTGSTVAAVGGFLNGEIIEFSNDSWVDVTPSGAVQVNGVHFGAGGDVLAAGINASTLRRNHGVWEIENNGLNAINDLDFHGAWVEADGDAWAVGGNTTFAPLDRGVVAYYGADNPGGPVQSAEPEPQAAAGQVCPRIGTCCSAAGVCAPSTPPSECYVAGGTYRGDGSTCALPCGFADCDGGGIVDIDDYAEFEACRTGASTRCCDVFDSNADNVLDLLDWGALQTVFSIPECVDGADCDDCDPCTTDMCNSGACTSAAVPIDLTGNWTVNRQRTSSGGTGFSCIDPPASDSTMVDVVQTGSNVTLFFSFTEDVDGNDLIDGSPGQLWFEFIPFSCPVGDPFTIAFDGELVGKTLTATATSPEWIPYCGCSFKTFGTLSATVDDCGTTMTGSMSTEIDPRWCPQFPISTCDVSHDFSATLP